MFLMMKNMLEVFAYLLTLTCISVFALLPANSYACQDYIWKTSEKIEKSEEVYIGRVTSVSIPDLEKVVLKKEQENFSIRTIERIMRIKIYESLKGESIGVIEVKLRWCRGGHAELGNLVVLYHLSKEWHVNQTSEFLAIARQTLKK